MIDPKRAPAYVGRGDAYVKSGGTEENLTAAKADYERAIEFDETSAEAYLGLADMYVRQGDTEKALEILRKGLEKASQRQDILDAIAAFDVTAKGAYGQTEFTSRRKYYPYNNMSAKQKELIETALSTALNQNGGKAFNFYNEEAWDDPSLFNREQYGVCTILDEYKISLDYDPDAIAIEVRPESGIGYYFSVGPAAGNATMGGDYQINLSSCSCTAWQWDGVLNVKIFTVSAGTGLALYGEESGTMKEGLREGIFEGTYSRYNYQRSELYRDGVLIESDGRAIENSSTIGGIIWFGGAKDQWIDSLYW